MTRQTKQILLFALIAAILGGVSYGGYRYRQSRQTPPKPQGPSAVGEPTPTPTPTPITQPTADPNWNLFTNEEYGFSVEYPVGWEAKVTGDLFFESGVVLREPGFGSFFVLVSKNSSLDVLEWVTENWNMLVLEEEKLPKELNATIAGLRSLVGYSPPGENGWASAFAVLKEGNRFFVIVHKSGKRNAPLLWDIYEHFLRTFEFENTENIPDKLPEFPMGF